MSKKGEKVKERANKPTNAEYEYRVSQVYSWILNGASYNQILRKCAELWGIRDRAVDNLIKRAREDVGRVSDDEKASAFGGALKRLNDLYMISKMNNDIKTCLAIQREINDLYHLKAEESKQSNITIVVADDPNDFV